MLCGVYVYCYGILMVSAGLVLHDVENIPRI